MAAFAAIFLWELLDSNQRPESRFPRFSFPLAFSLLCFRFYSVFISFCADFAPIFQFAIRSISNHNINAQISQMADFSKY